MSHRVVSFHFGTFTLEVDEELDYGDEIPEPPDVPEPPDTLPMSVTIQDATTPHEDPQAHSMLVREWTDRLRADLQEFQKGQALHCTTCGGSIELEKLGPGARYLPVHKSTGMEYRPENHRAELNHYWHARLSEVHRAQDRLAELTPEGS